jgi:hypothetical protein
MKTLTTTLALAFTAMATLAVPALAADSQQGSSQFAVDPTTQQYADSLTGAQNSAGGGTTPDTGGGVASEPSGGGGGGGLGSLPFTGTDLIALGAIALCLVATGLLLQSLSRPRRD